MTQIALAYLAIGAVAGVFAGVMTFRASRRRWLDGLFAVLAAIGVTFVWLFALIALVFRSDELPEEW